MRLPRVPLSFIAGWLALAAGPALAGEPAAAPEGLAAEVAALRAEVEELRTESVTREVSQHEPALRLSGFLDVGLQKMFMGPHAQVQAILPTDATTFVLGSLDLYLDAQPLPDWSAFVELRLTNVPDGQDVIGTPGSPYRRTSTTVYDGTAASGGWSTLHLGGLIIERAYAQWRYSDLFNARVGEFLTPAGIWNVDHGTPTLIALMLPQFMQVEMLPVHQLGVQVFGVYHATPWELGYHAYVSNGRTPGQFDLTDDKALGGRLFARRIAPMPMTFGLSFYVGTFSDQVRNVVAVAPFTVERTERVGYDEQGLGADASIDVGKLRLRTELTAHRVVYNPDARESQFGMPGVFWADRLEVDWYLLAAYQLPWLGLEPYIYCEVLSWPTILADDIVAPSVGLNVHFTPATQLKLQLMRHIFDRDVVAVASDNDVTTFAARAVIAF